MFAFNFKNSKRLKYFTERVLNANITMQETVKPSQDIPVSAKNTCSKTAWKAYFTTIDKREGISRQSTSLSSVCPFV